jgi:Bacterial regulatory proteins, luxR family
VHRPGALTRRERQVAELAAGGYTTAQIANRLYIGVRTVETPPGPQLHQTRSRIQAATRGPSAEPRVTPVRRLSCASVNRNPAKLDLGAGTRTRRRRITSACRILSSINATDPNSNGGGLRSARHHLDEIEGLVGITPTPRSRRVGSEIMGCRMLGQQAPALTPLASSPQLPICADSPLEEREIFLFPGGQFQDRQAVRPRRFFQDDVASLNP